MIHTVLDKFRLWGARDIFDAVNVVLCEASYNDDLRGDEEWGEE